MQTLSNNTIDCSSSSVFSALDFLSVFFSNLKMNNRNLVSSERVFEAVGEYRDKYLELFLDIDVSTIGGRVYSEELNDALSMLQILGAIGKTNPRYESIILKIDKESANEVIEKCPTKYKESINNFTSDYLNSLA